MNYSLTLSKEQLAKLKVDFKAELQPFDNQYILFVIKIMDCRITAYKSGKVLFQGQDAETFYQIIKNKYPSDNQVIDCAGSDEVGTGDYFGPIVVCACYLSKEQFPLIEQYQIADSKQISDATIRLIGPKLYQLLPNSLLILPNSKYNEVIKDNNLNAIKAKLHNQAYLNLSKKLKSPPNLAIIDQFTPASNYFTYLKDEKKVFSDLTFVTKAESKYPVVAAASIIARYSFLLELDKLSKRFNFPFPKGAGPKVDQALLSFLQRYPDKLQEVAKINFKNTKKIQENLKLDLFT